MASSTDDSIFFQERRAEGKIIVRDVPKLELESYISNYEGRTRSSRLITIAHTSPPLAAEAFRMAIIEAKQGLDVNTYLQLTEEFQKLLPDDTLAQIDTDWAESTTKRAKAETDRLEHELKTYKNNLIKESIRMGQDDLGMHYFQIGDLATSFKAYAKMRDFCTTQRQIAQMTFRLLYVAICQSNWAIATSYQPKIAALQIAPEDKLSAEPVLFMTVGLANLSQGNYKEAATAFLNVDQRYMTPEPQGGILFQKAVMTPNDVAIYGGLCALATMNRAQLQRRVLDNSSFRPLLELEPHIRRMISMFCASKYKNCLQVLESYLADYMLDLYLQRHFLNLYQAVRSKCLVQWFSAYSRVTWKEIEEQFPNNISDLSLEAELRDMIQKGDLDARIDLVDKVLVSPNPDSRISVIQDTLDMAKDTEHLLRLRLHNIQMRAAGLIVKPANQQGSMSGYSELVGQGSDFFGAPMTTRSGGNIAGAPGKMKRGSSGMGQSNANMI